MDRELKQIAYLENNRTLQIKRKKPLIGKPAKMEDF
jgi:hypothetical protein